MRLKRKIYMRKKIILCCLSDFDGSRFKDAAKEKLEAVGYDVVIEIWAENIEQELHDCFGLIAFVHLDLLEETCFAINSLRTLCGKYGVPIIGIQSNTETWSSELFWKSIEVDMIYYDDFVEKNVSPVYLKRMIEDILNEEERMVGYQSEMIH